MNMYNQLIIANISILCSLCNKNMTIMKVSRVLWMFCRSITDDFRGINNTCRVIRMSMENDVPYSGIILITLEVSFTTVVFL